MIKGKRWEKHVYIPICIVFLFFFLLAVGANKLTIDGSMRPLATRCASQADFGGNLV